MFESVLHMCQEAIRKQGKAVIAIDGMSASGKTTLSTHLSKELGCPVIHCDDFFLPLELRTKERLEEPGGNIDYVRMKEEVIDKLGEEVVYARFDCSRMKLSDLVVLPKNDVYIVEGAYAMHPYLGKYYDISFFMEIDSVMQLKRIEARNGDASMFQSRWIPMENRYISAYDVRKNADMVINASELVY